LSLQPASRASAFSPVASVDRVSSVPAPAQAGEDDALEFVRFCYRRRRVGWPAIYDEMSAVAARGAFRGMGYSELAERGISFCLADLSKLVGLTERVVNEEQSVSEPRLASVPLTIAAARY